jgi:hypothetical protein
MIRIDGGMLLRRIETKKFEHVMTKTTAKDMTTEVSILVVTANAEQIPRT